MNVLIKEEEKVSYVYKDIPIPQAGKGELLVKVLKVSLCGSDIILYEWNEGKVNTWINIKGTAYRGMILNLTWSKKLYIPFSTVLLPSRWMVNRIFIAMLQRKSLASKYYDANFQKPIHDSDKKNQVTWRSDRVLSEGTTPPPFPFFSEILFCF